MTEVRRADPTARRAAALMLVGGMCAGALLIAIFMRYRVPLGEWVRADRAQRGRLMFLLLTALVAGPLLGLAVYLWSLGERIVRAREFPPSGLRVIRDTPVITGAKAVVRGRLLKVLAIACAVASIVLAGLLWGLEQAVAEDLPAQLARTAAAKGCQAPPTDYVAGYFGADDSLGGVFWCRANLDDLDPRYLIIVVDRDTGRRMSCPNTMESVNRPLGLRILRDVRVLLSQFHSPSEWAKVGPIGRFATGPVIDTGDGGIGEQWICYDGAWLVHVYH